MRGAPPSSAIALRLRARLAAFANSSPKKSFEKLRGLTPDDQHLAKVVAAGLGLQIQGLSRHGVVTVRKPPDHDYSRSRAALQAACEDIGHRPFLRLLSQPLLEGGELDERDEVATAATISQLVRSCAADGRLDAMEQLLDEADAGGVLARHSNLHNRAVSAAMKALTNKGRPRCAIKLCESAIASQSMKPDAVSIMRLCIAARAEGPDAAKLAIEQVDAEMEKHGIVLNAVATDAYVHCCAAAGAAQSAFDAFVRGIADGGDGEGSSRGGVGSSRLEKAVQQHRLASVLSACERAKDADVAKQASGFAAEQGLQLDVASTNALITALCRGGAFKDGDRHFSRHLRRHALPRILPGGTDVAEAFGWDTFEDAKHERFWLPPPEAVKAVAEQVTREVEEERASSDGDREGGSQRLLPSELRETLNCVLASKARADTVFRHLREAAACGVTPDAFGLTAAFKSLRHISGDGGGYLPRDDGDGDGDSEPEMHPALVLFKWGLDLGVDPDMVLIDELMEATSVADTNVSMQVALLLEATQGDLPAEAQRRFGLKATQSDAADEELLPHDPVAPASISQLSTTDMLADMKSTLRAARERQEEEAPAAQEEEPNAEPAAAWPSNLARMLKSMGVAPK